MLDRFVREQLAGDKYYPRNFAGWQPLAAAVREELQPLLAGGDVERPVREREGDRVRPQPLCREEPVSAGRRR